MAELGDELDGVMGLEKRWAEVHRVQASTELGRVERERIGALAKQQGLSTDERVKILKDLETSVVGESEASRGALFFADGSAGVEVLAGGSRNLATRVSKHRGYTLVAWVREEGCVPQFEMASICGSLSVTLEALTNDPANGVRWRCQVFRSRSRSRVMGVCRIADFEPASPLRKWRCVVITHAARYLSQAELTVTVDGAVFTFDDGNLCANVPLPTAEDADTLVADDTFVVVHKTDVKKLSPRDMLRPPALRVLKGFRGIAGSMTLYEGALTPESVSLIRELGPRAPSGLVRQQELHRRGSVLRHKQWSGLAKHRVIVALEPSRQSSAVATSLRCSSCSARAVAVGLSEHPTSLAVTLRGGVTWESGPAAVARRALTAAGGAPLLVAVLLERSDTLAETLKTIAAALEHCGAEHADTAAHSHAMAMLGSRLRCLSKAAFLGNTFVEAAFAVVEASASHGGVLLAASIRAVWADEELWSSMSRTTRAELLKRLSERAAEPVFSAALREIGLAKLAHLASATLAGVKEDGDVAEYAAAFEKLAIATLQAELGDESIEDGDYMSSATTVTTPTTTTAEIIDDSKQEEEEEQSVVGASLYGVHGVLEALVSADVGDEVKCSLCLALSEAIRRTPSEPRRATVAAVLRDRRFAETTALSIIVGDNKEQEKREPVLIDLLSGDVEEEVIVENSADLRSAVLRLALWQYMAAERSLRTALAAAKKSDGYSAAERSEATEARLMLCAKALRVFRAAALRSVAALAAAAASALDSATWNLDPLQLCCWLINTASQNSEMLPLWLSLPFVAAVASRAPKGLLESTVASVCVLIKSRSAVQAELAELEPWYTVGSLLRLAKTSGYDDTVELLALDALAALLLRKKYSSSMANLLMQSSRSSSELLMLDAEDDDESEAALELDTRALETTSRALAVGGYLWEHRALLTITAQLVRRLTAEVSKREAVVAQTLAKLLSRTLETVWPPPPIAPHESDAQFGSRSDLRSMTLATAVLECSASLRQAARTRREAELVKLMTKPASGAVFSRLFLGQEADVKKKPLEQAYGERAMMNPELGDATLLALRRAARTLAHGLYWGVQDEWVAQQLTTELRSCLVCCLELADERAHRGSTSAAIVACDDILHALACLRACLQAAAHNRNLLDITDAGKTPLVLVCEAAARGLVEDVVDTTGGGVAAACCRAALQPASGHMCSAEEMFRHLDDQLDAALLSERDDLNDMLLEADLFEEHEEDMLPTGGTWLEPPNEPNSLQRRTQAARLHCARARRSLETRSRDDALFEQRGRLEADELATTARADAIFELGCYEEQEGQRRWQPELELGDGLGCPSVVSERATPIEEPFRPHDETKYEPMSPKILQHNASDQDLARTIKILDVGLQEPPAEVTFKDITKEDTTLLIDDDDDDSLVMMPPPHREESRGSLTDFRGSLTESRGSLTESVDEDMMICGFPTREHIVDSPPAVAAAQLEPPVSSPSDTKKKKNPPVNLKHQRALPQKTKEQTDLLFSTGKCTRVLADATRQGSLSVTRARFSFLGLDTHNGGFSRRLRDCRGVLLRRFRLRDTAIELFFKEGSIFIDCFHDVEAEGSSSFRRGESDESPKESHSFSTSERGLAEAKQERDDLARKVGAAVRSKFSRMPGGMGVLPLIQTPGQPVGSLVHRCTRAWQERRLDNYTYLLLLNALAGRSFNDTCQYPVFPWVVADYASEELDLSNPASFRDLSKPMGAMNEVRLAETMSRYESFDDVHVPKFHYGSHYSTSAGVVIHFLLRMAPRFASLHCELQSGRFDVADRLFTSISEAWDGNSGAAGMKASSEVKELVPEFYSTPSFLTNDAALPLGYSQDGKQVGDVELPPWAKNSPAIFVARHRAALESEYVSMHLHLWIDLIFGLKQRGKAAVENANVFFYLCYADTVDLEAITDPALRRATVLQASHFGQCPAQLLPRKPHPPRGQLQVKLPRPLRASPAVTLLAPAAGSDSSAVARAVGLSGSFRAKAILAMRTTDRRCLVVNGSGAVCVLAWSYETIIDEEAETEQEEDPASLKTIQRKRRVATIRALTCADDETDSRLSRRAATHLGLLSPNSLDMSRDCSIIACAAEDDVTALRIVEVDLGDHRGLHATAIGDASVVAHGAPLTLVRCLDPFSAYGEGDGSVLVLCGAADGTASLWCVHRSVKGRWSRGASSSLARRAEAVYRGHFGAVVAGDANCRLGCCVTGATDGALLVHALSSGRLLRRLTTGGETPRHVRISSTGVVVSARQSPQEQQTTLQVHSVNGGEVAKLRVDFEVSRMEIVGELEEALMLVGGSKLELRDLHTLASLRVLRLGMTEDSRLVSFDLAPDARHPAALFVATSTGEVALRLLEGAEEWADRRAAENGAGVGSFIAKRAGEALGLAAAAIGRGRDLASATSDVVGEARDALSKQGSARRNSQTSTKKINSNNNNNNAFTKAIGRFFHAKDAKEQHSENNNNNATSSSSSPPAPFSSSSSASGGGGAPR